MKVAAAFFLIILIGIAVYSFFDYALKNWGSPGYFQLKESASVSNPIKAKSTNPKSTTVPENPDNNPQPTNPQLTNPQSNDSQTDVSPYFGKVEISGIQAESYYNPSLITLSFWLREGDKIDITNWKIKARQGEIIIPKVIEKYQYFMPSQDIIIEKYGRIYLIGSRNPLGGGKNFRLNKCFGYLGNYYSYCPRPKLEEISHLNPYCQEYILNLSSCEIPDYSNNIKISTDYQCVSFIIDNFNYAKCFEKHYQDQDFLMDSWYVFTNTNIVEKLHDTIYLLDQNNLLVDKYLY